MSVSYPQNVTVSTGEHKAHVAECLTDLGYSLSYSRELVTSHWTPDLLRLSPLVVALSIQHNASEEELHFMH